MEETPLEKPAVKQPVVFDPDLAREYELLKSDIIANFGEPHYTNNKPTNKAGRRVAALGVMLRKRQRDKHRDKKFRLIAKEINLDNSFSVPLPEEYLLSFSEAEKRVIRLYFSTPFPDHNVIAKKSELDGGVVLRFLNGSAFQTVKRQIMESFKETLEHESLVAIRQCIRSPIITAQKLNAAMAILEDSGLIKGKADTEINIYNDSIDDPIAEAELRKLGDRLAKEKSIPN